MKLDNLIQQCHRHTKEEKEAFLTSVLSRIVADKYGPGTKSLISVGDSIRALVSTWAEKGTNDKDFLFLLTVLDVLLGCIAKEMLSRDEFDILNLRMAAEAYLATVVK